MYLCGLNSFAWLNGLKLGIFAFECIYFEFSCSIERLGAEYVLLS
jgi:hypothetical protein